MAGFELLDLDGATHRLEDYMGDIVVLDFWSAECSWSKHYDRWLVEKSTSWKAEGVHLLAVASNVNESVQFLRETANARGITFPILCDPDCTVAHQYSATTTPHIFVIDRAGQLAYQGAIDDRSFRKRQASVNYLEKAVDALQAGRKPDPARTAPYGCTIVCPQAEEGTPG